MSPTLMMEIQKNISEGLDMYSLYWTNHGYPSDEEFNSIGDAIDYGKSKGFDFSVLDANGANVAHFTLFGGVHYTLGTRPGAK